MYQVLVNNLYVKGNERFDFHSLADCKKYISELPNGDYIVDILELNKISGNYMVTETFNIDKKEITMKEIIAYLPYGSTFYVDMEKFTDFNCKPELRKFKLDTENSKLCLLHGKLALRPLSDLTKEIEHKGENFIPKKELLSMFNCIEFDIMAFESDFNNMPYELVQKILEWNFDIFGLIGEDLAIDINSFV